MAMIIKYQARRWDSARLAAAAPAKKAAKKKDAPAKRAAHAAPRA